MRTLTRTFALDRILIFRISTLAICLLSASRIYNQHAIFFSAGGNFMSLETNNDEMVRWNVTITTATNTTESAESSRVSEKNHTIPATTHDNDPDKEEKTLETKKKPTMVKKELKNFVVSASSRSVTLFNNSVVKTYNSNYDKLNMLEREVCVLRHLQQFPWSPRLIDHTDRTITTSFVGDPVTDKNIPMDYKEQLQTIIHDMESVGMRHNDAVYPCFKFGEWQQEDKHRMNTVKREVMVLDGRLSIVDFGLATINDEVPCGVSNTKFPDKWGPCPDSRLMDVLDRLAEYNNTATAVQGAI